MRSTEKSAAAPAIQKGKDWEGWAKAREREALRGVLRRELRVHKGTRVLSREIGVHRGSIRKFVSGQSEPTPDTLSKMEDWAADRPPVRPANGAVALAILAGELPPLHRPDARRRLASELVQAFQRAGERPPPWLSDELEDDSEE